jgi:hypothetical protein
MGESFWNSLQVRAGGDLQCLPADVQQRLRMISKELGWLLRDTDDSARSEILAKISGEVRDHLDSLKAEDTREIPDSFEEERAKVIASRVPIDPEIIEWAMKDFDEKAYIAQIEEIKRTGGYELKDFIDEVERAALGHD